MDIKCCDSQQTALVKRWITLLTRTVESELIDVVERAEEYNVLLQQSPLPLSPPSPTDSRSTAQVPTSPRHRPKHWQWPSSASPCPPHFRLRDRRSRRMQIWQRRSRPYWDYWDAASTYGRPGVHSQSRHSLWVGSSQRYASRTQATPRPVAMMGYVVNYITECDLKHDPMSHC